MKTSLFLVFILIILLFPGLSHSWWPFSEEETPGRNGGPPEEQRRERMEGGQESVRLVRFESVSLEVEKKFLDEAKQLLRISPLQKCQHNVMMLLNDTCHDMDDEEHAKLSVRLMNCQSEAEGRPTFKCTQKMSIADCTRGMDPDTWTTYHIISNRARALCYVRAQQQFRIQTEAVVNRLKSVTLQHLKDAENLAQINDQLRQETNNALEELKKGQDDILDHQTRLKSSQELLGKFMDGNIDIISEMETALKARVEELHNVTNKLQTHLESAHDKSVQREKERLKLQEATNKELHKLNNNVQEVWHGIDTITRDLFIKYKEVSTQYQTVMNNMEAMNSSITQLLLLMDAMNIGFTQKLTYLNETLGGTQGALHIVTSIISHLSFFLFSILVSLFLEVPFKPKFCLFILVTGSLVTDIMFGKGLSFLGLTGTLATILIGYYGFQTLQKSHSTRKPRPLPRPRPSLSLSPPSPLPHPNDMSQDELMEDDSVNESHSSVFPPPSTPLRPAVTLTAQRPLSARSHRNAKCSSLTRSGLPCQLGATPPSPYCHRHKPAVRRREGRK